ncbi:MAG: SUMF1/EgtB/PvdO family nonheme iron enzyme [Bacteroidales bacterium]|nr:SUMF1/EgtB/PvdO family nonheme iron enzyme [Bacteroidales bacterium]
MSTTNQNQDKNVVFISWANDECNVGKNIGKLFYNLLKHKLFKNMEYCIDVYYSPVEDGLWEPELLTHLKKGCFGIFIVTPEFLDSIWCAVEFGGVLINNFENNDGVVKLTDTGSFLLPIYFEDSLDKGKNALNVEQMISFWEENLDDVHSIKWVKFIEKIIHRFAPEDKIIPLGDLLIKEKESLEQEIRAILDKGKHQYIRNYMLRISYNELRDKDQQRFNGERDLKHQIVELKEKLTEKEEEIRDLNRKLFKIEKKEESHKSFPVIVEGKEYGKMIFVKVEQNRKKCEYNEKGEIIYKFDDYYIGETQVTQALWCAVMKDIIPNPSQFNDNLQKPVDNVSFDECMIFIDKLNNQTGKVFCLPTKDEWQYAASGGTKSRKNKYSGCNDPDLLKDYAWFLSNSQGKTRPVGTTKFPNELGLYDMSGNVNEWCNDYHICGGAWNSPEEFCEITKAEKIDSMDDYKCNSLGLRLCYHLL